MIRAFLTVGVVVASTIGAVSSGSVLKDIPGCTVQDGEKCGLDFVPFFKTPRLAETPKDLQDQCKLYNGQLACVKNFSDKCLEGLAKGVVSLMIEAATEEYAVLCNTTTPRHKEYLDSVKCINKAGPEVQMCMQELFVALHRVPTAPANKQIGHTCCYYQDFVDCSEKGLKSNCNLPAAVKFFNLVIEKVVGEALSVACGKYKKGSGACEALPALSKKNDSNARGKGFIGPLVGLAGTLG